jgi:hypothetical protein
LRHGGANAERQRGHCSETKGFDSTHELNSFLRAPKHFGDLSGEEEFLVIPTPSTRKWLAVGEKIMANGCKSLMCQTRKYRQDDGKYMLLSET